MVKVGVIGCGYWGPNLIRNFSKVPDCRLEAVADQKPERLASVRHLNSEMRTTTEANELVESDSIDAVVIATPISTAGDSFGVSTIFILNAPERLPSTLALRKLA